MRRHRTGKGWTLDDLTRESGVSRRTIVNVEGGAHNTGIANLVDISAALGLPLTELLAEAELKPDE